MVTWLYGGNSCRFYVLRSITGVRDNLPELIMLTVGSYMHISVVLSAKVTALLELQHKKNEKNVLLSFWSSSCCQTCRTFYIVFIYFCYVTPYVYKVKRNKRKIHEKETEKTNTDTDVPFSLPAVCIGHAAIMTFGCKVEIICFVSSWSRFVLTQDFQEQKLAFLEFLSQKYPNYAYSICSPGGTHYVMVRFLFLMSFLRLIFCRVCCLAGVCYSPSDYGSEP